MKTNWKKNNDPNYLGEWDIEGKNELKLTINKIVGEDLTMPGGIKERRNVAYFKEKYHPMVINATNAKMLAKMAGSKYIEDWENLQIAVFYDPNIKFGREKVGGLRVRAPKIETYICSDCGEEIKDSGKYKATVIAQNAKSKYGRFLCVECSKKAKLEMETKKDNGGVL